MLDVFKLGTLRVVLAEGSLSAAAEALHLSQPAVSRQISLLERNLGTALVRRTHRGVVGTEAGKLLARRADAVLEELRRTEAEVRELAGFHRGTIRLGSFFTAMVYLSAAVAIELEERHPGLVVTDDLCDRVEACAKLARGALDVAIVFHHDFQRTTAPDGIETVPLFEDPIRLLLPHRHPLAMRRSLRLAELGGETWVKAHDGSAAALVDHVLALAGLTPDLLLAGHGDEPIEAQALVAAGRGVTVANDLNVIIDPDQIVVRPLSGPVSCRHVEVAYSAARRNPAITAVVDALARVGHERRARLGGA